MVASTSKAAADRPARDGTTTLNQSRLVTGFGRSTLDASVLDTVRAVDGVSEATAALSLTNMTFSGSLPQRQSGTAEGGAQTAPQEGEGSRGQGGEGGGGGFQGGSFGVDSFSVLGVDPGATAAGPLTAATVSADARAHLF